jgi:hypothetical protein
MEVVMSKISIHLLLVFLAVSLLGRTQSKKKIPAELAHARYVALGYDLGTGFLSDSEITLAQVRVTAEDRQALQRVRDQIAEWKRYAITIKPKDADLLIAVRTGRLAAANGGLEIGRHDGTIRTKPFYGEEVSSPDDMLEVYQSHDGREGTLLWRDMQKNGLAGSPSPLFEQFKRDVASIPNP